MNRRALLASIAALILTGACGRSVRLSAVEPGARVLAFGDSVTFGTGAAPGEDWPSLLAAKTGWQVINAGLPGDTARAGRDRLPALLDEHRPALLIIEIGGNDFLRRSPARDVKEDIRAMIRSARRASVPAVLLAVPEPSLFGIVAGKPGDSPIYEELAEEEAIPLVGEVFSDVLGRKELRADNIHPNAAGYREMAAGIHARLRKLGLWRDG